MRFVPLQNRAASDLRCDDSHRSICVCQHDKVLCIECHQSPAVGHLGIENIMSVPHDERQSDFGVPMCEACMQLYETVAALKHAVAQ